MIKSKIVCKLVIQINNNFLHFTAFNDAVESFLSLNGTLHKPSEISDNDLKLSVLKSGPITMLVDKSRTLLIELCCIAFSTKLWFVL